MPFAFMRTDLAGNTSKRFSLPELRLPRHGSACPLWAVYRAFLTPDRITTQLMRLPDDRHFLVMARAITKGPTMATGCALTSRRRSRQACTTSRIDRQPQARWGLSREQALKAVTGGKQVESAEPRAFGSAVRRQPAR